MTYKNLTLEQIHALKRFSVLLTRDCAESVTVYVLAKDKDDAFDAALEEARENPLKWEVNENYGDDPYLGSGITDDITEITDGK